VATQDVVTLVGALGFPIVLVLGLLWFVKRDFWPWYVKYVAERTAAQDARHKDYIKTIERSNEAIDALVGLITRIDTRLEDHTRRLGIIEAAARAAAAMRGS
jgi:hypothetical protein